MSVHRIDKKGNFTTMSNNHLRNEDLSFKARGILSTMLSLPDDWEYTLAGLAKLAKDGITSVRAGVVELEEMGYLVRRQDKAENGTYLKGVYDIYEIPYEEYCALNKTQCTDKADTSYTENYNDDLILSDILTSDDPTSDKPLSENLMTDNLTQLNTNIPNTVILNTERLNKPFISKKEKNFDQYADISIHPSYLKKIDLPDKEVYEKNKALIKSNIYYDDFVYTKGCDISLVDDIVEVMTEIVTFAKGSMCINGFDIPAEIVKSRFLEANYENISYALFTLSRHTGKIHNIRKYLISVIYNSLNCGDTYFAAEVRHDMYG